MERGMTIECSFLNPSVLADCFEHYRSQRKLPDIFMTKL